jgi:hypothetical protein
MKTMRIVVAGTPGAGKSTFVRTISEIEVVDTERAATDETGLLKKKTTVAFDFGRVSFGSIMELQIYGTPGQSRFNFMWDFLIKNAHTYILLVAANRPDDVHYARQILSFMNQRAKIPMIVGLTHTDCPGACSQEELMMRLGYMNDRHRPPIVHVNPTMRASVNEALMTMMALLLAQYGTDQPLQVGQTNRQPQTPVRSTNQFSTASLFSRGR